MNPVVRYQVFLSSTYEDLREERQQATQAILEAGCFPSGMELFPASDDTQWELIKKVIEESDYYIVIVAGRYGSVGPGGLSYTEMEYDYAVERNIPILGFLNNSLNSIPFSKIEKSDEGRAKLDAFRVKVQARMCRQYTSAPELGMAVMKSLMSESRLRPRTGWIRSDYARSDEDIQRERQLNQELHDASERISELEREIRDRQVLIPEIVLDDLAHGDDFCSIGVIYSDVNKNQVSERVEMTWDDLFRVIAPSMYGYVVRDQNNEGGRFPYPFLSQVEQYIRGKIIEKVQTRKISLLYSDLEMCVLQFKELGLVMYDELKIAGDRTFRGITLTEAGERYLTKLAAKFRSR